MALSTYRTETRRLLHDANARFWSNSQLDDYINEARRQVACDTHCLRSLETINFVANTETYAVATLTSKAERCVDILNITLIYGNQRIPLFWCAWTDFNAKFRVWQTNTNRPAAFSLYGMVPMATLYVQPVPNTAYTAEADICYVPIPLVDDSTVDEIVYPCTKPVAFYAAHLAKYSEQSYGEAQTFLVDYARKALECINTYTRRVPSAYAEGGGI